MALSKQRRNGDHVGPLAETENSATGFGDKKCAVKMPRRTLFGTFSAAYQPALDQIALILRPLLACELRSYPATPRRLLANGGWVDCRASRRRSSPQHSWPALAEWQ